MKRILLIIITAITFLYIANIHAEEPSFGMPIITFYPSHLSPDNSILALNLWTRKNGRLTTELGFLNLETGRLMPEAVNYTLLGSKRKYIERESFSWHPNNEWIYFTLHETNESFTFVPTSSLIFRYDVKNSIIDTLRVISKENQLIYPVISKDAEFIIFIGYDVSNDSHTGTLYNFHIDSKETDVLDVKIDISKPVISLDCRKVAYMKNGNLHTISLDTKQVNKISNMEKRIQNSVMTWLENDLYFVSVRPASSDLTEEEIEKMNKMRWTGDEEPIIKEVWHISFKEKINNELIASFKTKKVGISLIDNSALLIPLPDKENSGANIWKYQLQNKELIQLTFDNYDDLPLFIQGKNKIYFRRNARSIYSVDLSEKQKPEKIY